MEGGRVVFFADRLSKVVHWAEGIVSVTKLASHSDTWENVHRQPVREMVKEIVLTVTEVGRVDYNVFLDVKTIEGMYEISPSLMETLYVTKLHWIARELSCTRRCEKFAGRGLQDIDNE